MPKIRINDRTVHYWTGRVKQPVEGRGLLLLHGAGGNGLGWFMQKQALGSRTFCCAPDLPGHGRSTGKPPATIDEYVPYVLGLMDHLKIEKASLVGHSMGGAVAQTLALDHPDRVEKLVLIGTGACLPVSDRLFDVLEGDEEEALRFLIDLVFTQTAPQEFVRNVMDQMDFASAPDDFAACRTFDVSGRLASLSIPVAVLVGEQDRMTPVEVGRTLAESIPGAALHVIEGAAHLPMLERAGAVNAIILEFLGLA